MSAIGTKLTLVRGTEVRRVKRKWNLLFGSEPSIIGGSLKIAVMLIDNVQVNERECKSLHTSSKQNLPQWGVSA